MSDGEEVLGFREKLAYGAGDLASVLYWQTFMSYLTFFYTDVFGIGALAAGTLLGVSRSVVGFVDPVMGMLADRTETRWGKFRPYLLWLCGPLAGAGVLCFTVPDLSDSGKLVWAWVTFNLLMLFYSGINIPYTALMAVVTPSPAERTALSSIKFVFSFAAGMIVSAALLPMVKLFGGDHPARGWQTCFVIFGAAAVALLLITFLGTKERVQPPTHQKSSVRGDLRDLFGNGPWIWLLVVTLFFILFVAVRSSVVVYYFKYFVGDQTLTLPAILPLVGGTQRWHLEALVSAFNTTGQLAALLGVLLVPFFAKAVGRKLAFASLLIVTLASVASFYFLKPHQLGLIFGLNALGALTGGPLSALLWAMYADTVDYAEWKTHRRSTGLLFSASMFASKQSWAIGSVVALGLMSRLGFVANTEQTPESVHGLLLLMSWVPVVFGAVALASLLLYPLTESVLGRIGAELKIRRDQEASLSRSAP